MDRRRHPDIEGPALNHPALIIGGGLAGLTAARILHRAGVGFLLLEARDQLGGRILSVDASGHASSQPSNLPAFRAVMRP